MKSEFNITQTPIEGLLIIEPATESALIDIFSREEFSQFGITEEFVEERQVSANRGEIHGLHFQRHEPQAKLIRAESGSLLDVVVDLRPESRTYGASHSVELSAENRRIFYVPARFAHGFLSLEKGTNLLFRSSTHADAESASGVIWNDPVLCIDWQFERYDIDEKYLKISKQDRKLPSYGQLNPKTLWI